MISEKLKQYIEKNIFPSYAKNDLGHNIDHIYYVIKRSLKFAESVPNINYNMVYTIAAYHDIAHYIDAKNHEKLSAEMLANDINLKQFFSDEEIKIMSEAVYDHRASMEGEPRSIYGKIVSSADRNTIIDIPLKRTYAYRIKHCPNSSLEQILEESRQHIINKFGSKGYATEKMYFDDPDYTKFLEEIAALAEDKEAFKKRYYEVNKLNNKLKITFDEIRKANPNYSLDEVLFGVYDAVKDEYKKPFAVLKYEILEANNINELDYYTKDVDATLKMYIRDEIFPKYKDNDGGHGIEHIMEVIRRSFALNDTYKLRLNDNMIYTIAACHDWGKWENSDLHHEIAADHTYNDPFFGRFFNDDDLITIKEAIEDHRSSKDDEPRSTYGKLVSSADRNTSIEIVFIRSFYVAQFRVENGKDKDQTIEDYLDYTIKRLSKRYSEENPENMFYEDRSYTEFLKDMRDLLKREEDFKIHYCEVNNITSRTDMVSDYIKNNNYQK